MEILGDLERAFASAIYPNRDWSRSSPSSSSQGWPTSPGGVDGLRRSTPPARGHCRPAHRDRDPRPAWVDLGSPLVLSRTIDEPPPVAAAASPTPSTAPTTPEPVATPSPTERASSAPALGERSGSFPAPTSFTSGAGPPGSSRRRPACSPSASRTSRFGPRLVRVPVAIGRRLRGWRHRTRQP